MDADVHIDRDAITELVRVLARAILARAAVGPATHFLTAEKPFTIRAFYYVMDHLPSHQAWQATHLAGRGVYGANRVGRRVFDQFPQRFAMTTHTSTSCSTTPSEPSSHRPT